MSTEEEWCDYGDMLKITCEHCKTGEKNAGEPLVRGVDLLDTVAQTPVLASLNGTCPLCKEDILAGRDWLIRTTRGWAHDDCGRA